MEVHVGDHDLFRLFVDLHDVKRLAERRHDAREVIGVDKEQWFCLPFTEDGLGTSLDDENKEKINNEDVFPGRIPTASKLNNYTRIYVQILTGVNEVSFPIT